MRRTMAESVAEERRVRPEAPRNKDIDTKFRQVSSTMARVRQWRNFMDGAAIQSRRDGGLAEYCRTVTVGTAELHHENVRDRSPRKPPIPEAAKLKTAERPATRLKDAKAMTLQTLHGKAGSPRKVRQVPVQTAAGPQPPTNGMPGLPQRPARKSRPIIMGPLSQKDQAYLRSPREPHRWSFGGREQYEDDIRRHHQRTCVQTERLQELIRKAAAAREEHEEEVMSAEGAHENEFATSLDSAGAEQRKSEERGESPGFGEGVLRRNDEKYAVIRKLYEKKVAAQIEEKMKAAVEEKLAAKRAAGGEENEEDERPQPAPEVLAETNRRHVMAMAAREVDKAIQNSCSAAETRGEGEDTDGVQKTPNDASEVAASMVLRSYLDEAAHEEILRQRERERVTGYLLANIPDPAPSKQVAKAGHNKENSPFSSSRPQSARVPKRPTNAPNPPPRERRPSTSAGGIRRRPSTARAQRVGFESVATSRLGMLTNNEEIASCVKYQRTYAAEHHLALKPKASPREWVHPRDRQKKREDEAFADRQLAILGEVDAEQHDTSLTPFS